MGGVAGRVGKREWGTRGKSVGKIFEGESGVGGGESGEGG